MAAPTAKSGGRAAALQRCFATFSNGPTRGAYTEIVRNGLGARGIDYVEVFKTGSAISVRFPVYDGHGNMTACLLRDGAGGFTLTSRRAYDPWGAMRQWGTHPSGASAYQGAPSNRYVGSLGHQQDDDSGLYYMRARYYEPGSGRFISEDPAKDGFNWFAYCENDPIQKIDTDGKLAQLAVYGLTALVCGIFNGLFRCMMSGQWTWQNFGIGFLEGAIVGFASCFGVTAGAIAGAAVSFVDAYLSGKRGNKLVASTVIGGFFGGLGGAASPVAAIAERNVILFLLLTFDESAAGTITNGIVTEW